MLRKILKKKSLLFLLFSFILSFFLAIAIQYPQPVVAQGKATPVSEGTAIDPARSFILGMHIENIYNLSLKDKSFAAEGWFWLEWPEAVQQLIIKNKIPLLELVEMVNQVEAWDSQIQLDSAEPELKPNGNRRQLYRFSAKFYDDSQTLKRFPFQQLELPIIIETRPTIFSLAAEAIRLNPSLDAKGVKGQYAGINGYKIGDVGVKSSIYTYNTNFGANNGIEGGEFSRVEYYINYNTEFWSAFYQYVMPWLAVMAMLVLAPNLEGKLTELRLATPSTALLTLVFLQLGTNADLPKLSYISFIDQLYLFGYIASIVLFALFVWGSNAYQNSIESQREAVMQKINKIDAIYQSIIIGGSVFIAVASFGFR